MVDQAEPGADVCRVSWCGEIADSVQVPLAGANVGRRDLEAGELDCVCTEDELVRIKGDTVASTEVKPGDCLKEALR